MIYQLINTYIYIYIYSAANQTVDSCRLLLQVGHSVDDIAQAREITWTHRSHGKTGRQLPQVPVTTRTEHRVWWVGQKESCESATLIHTSDTPFGLSLKLKGVSELNDIK